MEWTHCTPETTAAALRACRQERIENGLDPDTGRPLRLPVNTSVREPLQIIHWDFQQPFRVCQDVDRATELQIAVQEFIEQHRVTAEELLDAVQKLVAAERGDVA